MKYVVTVFISYSICRVLFGVGICIHKCETKIKLSHFCHDYKLKLYLVQKCCSETRVITIIKKAKLEESEIFGGIESFQTVEIGKNNEKISRKAVKTCCHSASRKNHLLLFVWKIRKGLWDFEIQMSLLTPTKRPDQVLIYKKKRTCYLVDLRMKIKKKTKRYK